jgi:hypothetical protein
VYGSIYHPRFISVDIVGVPEPSSAALAAVGALGLVAFARRRKAEEADELHRQSLAIKCSRQRSEPQKSSRPQEFQKEERDRAATKSREIHRPHPGSYRWRGRLLMHDRRNLFLFPTATGGAIQSKERITEPS